MKRRITIFLTVLGAIFLSSSAPASAQSVELLDQIGQKHDLFDLLKPEQPKQEKSKPEKKIHTINRGETLSKIALQYHTTVERLFDKNTDIKDPDQIAVNQKIIIPDPKEKLKHRKISTPSNITPVKLSLAPTSGNTYTYGYCTWYVKNRRPDISNGWGNADTWFSRAQAEGWAVGNKPKVGAVAAARGYMHVAYVIEVKGNRVKVAEMNYVGWNVASERWSDNSEWHYIY